jgi:1-acyl-sn-glycerol-3-phosphate acyltransferase
MSSLAIILIPIKGKSVFFGLSKHWAKQILFWGRVKVDIKGLDKLSDSETYIFCANHSSMVDIPVLISSIKHNFRIIYKQELKKIPFFGWGLSMSPYISIRRENPRDAMAGIEEAIDSIRIGESVVIYPEGTRTLDGNLGKFKRGAFMLAARSGKKIVPVTIIGSADVLPNKELLLRNGEIKIIISEPIEYKGTSKVDELELMNNVYEIIKSNLEKFKK